MSYTNEEMYIRFKNTIMVNALRKLITENNYTFRDILQFEMGVFLDTIPSADDSYKDNLKDELEDTSKSRYQHLNDIYSRIQSSLKKKVFTEEIKNSKRLAEESILDDIIIYQQDQLINNVLRDIGFRDIDAVRGNVVIPEEISRNITKEKIKRFEKYQLHEFTTDIHRYDSKEGKVSLLEMYILATLSEHIRGRTVGIIDKIISKSKACKKYSLIEQGVLSNDKDEMIYLLILNELFKCTGEYVDDLNNIEMENFINNMWLTTFPLLYMLFFDEFEIDLLSFDSNMDIDSLNIIQDNLWNSIEDDYYSIVIDCFGINLLEVNIGYNYMEMVTSVENLGYVKDLYSIIKKFKDELKKAVLNVIKTLPLFHSMDREEKEIF